MSGFSGFATMIADWVLEESPNNPDPTEEILSDLDLLTSCRLVPTSLLMANIARKPLLTRFQRAEALAHI